MKPLLSQFMLLPIHQIPVPVGSNMEMAIFWAAHQQEAVSYMNQIIPKMPFHPSDFCTKVKELPKSVEEELKAVFDNRFFWRAGEYRATMSAA
jgi:hypothetical protein